MYSIRTLDSISYETNILLTLTFDFEILYLCVQQHLLLLSFWLSLIPIVYEFDPWSNSGSSENGKLKWKLTMQAGKPNTLIEILHSRGIQFSLLTPFACNYIFHPFSSTIYTVFQSPLALIIEYLDRHSCTWLESLDRHSLPDWNLWIVIHYLTGISGSSFMYLIGISGSSFMYLTGISFMYLIGISGSSFMYLIGISGSSFRYITSLEKKPCVPNKTYTYERNFAKFWKE